MSNNTVHPTKATHEAIEDVDRHSTRSGLDSVPMPETGTHAHSPAAHLGTPPKEHTKPIVNQHPGTTRDQSRTRSG